MQQVTNEHIEGACVDQGYTGEELAQAAQQQGVTLEGVKLPEAKQGFLLNVAETIDSMTITGVVPEWPLPPMRR